MVSLESSTKETWKIRKLVLLTIFMWLASSQIFVALSFDLLYGTDSKAYLLASQNLDSFPPLELPLYPAMVALFRELLPVISPKIYMQGISLVAYVLAVVGVYLILEHYRSTLALFGALLFAMFPLEGVTLSVFPRVNSLMYLSVVGALLLYVKGYARASIAVMSLSLLTHKSVWPIVLVVGVVGVYDRRLKWWSLPLIFLPLIAYWVAGAFYHDDPAWLFNRSISVKFQNHSDINIPVFAGLIGTFKSGFDGDIADLIKAVIVTISFVLAAFLLFSMMWTTQKWLLGIILPNLLWPAVLNQGELWSSISYTHLIVLPLVFWLERSGLAWSRSRTVWLVILGACAASQIVWTVYIVRYFS